jgi:hypothetical protein
LVVALVAMPNRSRPFPSGRSVFIVLPSSRKVNASNGVNSEQTTENPVPGLPDVGVMVSDGMGPSLT